MRIESHTLESREGRRDRAWLDAARIAPEYAGIVCRMAIGRAGGLLCDQVRSEKPIGEMLIRKVATDAVIAVDQHEGDGEDPYLDTLLEDDRGEPVVLDTHEDETPRMDEDVVSTTKEEFDKLCILLPIPWPLILTATTLFAGCLTLMLIFRDSTPAAMGFFLTAMTSGIGLFFALDATRIALSHRKGTKPLRSIAGREAERRAVLDQIVEGNHEGAKASTE